MAVSIGRNLDILIGECQKYNLKPIPSKTNNKGIALSPFDDYVDVLDKNGNKTTKYCTVSKEDCVKVLQEYFIESYKSEGKYTQALDWVLKTDFQPMLCNQLKQCKWKDDIYNRDDECIAEEKIDGNRNIWCKFPGENIEIISRNLSVKDYLPCNYSKNIVITADYSKIVDSFVIDGEIVISRMPDDDALEAYGLMPGTTQLNLTSALLSGDDPRYQEFQKLYPLKLLVFDIIMYNGEDLTNKPLSERMVMLDKVYKQLLDAGCLIERPDNNRALGLSIEDFHKKMLMSGKEGSVVKLLNSTYDMSGNRSHDAWIKLKRTVTGDMLEQNLGDTIDGFITGFKAKASSGESSNNSWRVASVIFSINIIDDDPFSDTYNEILETKPIAVVGGLTEEFARSISEPDPDNPGYCRLKKEAYGMVGELTGQDISHESQTLTHPRLIRMRDDKPVNQCTMNKSFLEAQLLSRRSLR